MGECAEVLIELWGDNTYTPGSAPAPSAGAVPSSSRQPPPPSTSVSTPAAKLGGCDSSNGRSPQQLGRIQEI